MEDKHIKEGEHCCHCEGCPEAVWRPMTEGEAEIAADLDKLFEEEK